MPLNPRDVIMGNPPSQGYQPRKLDVVELLEGFQANFDAAVDASNDAQSANLDAQAARDATFLNAATQGSFPSTAAGIASGVPQFVAPDGRFIQAYNNVGGVAVPISGVRLIGAAAIFDPKYTNAGGQGDRRGQIRVFADAGVVSSGPLNALIDGDETAFTGTAVRFGLIDMTGKRIVWDFGAGASKVITEVTLKANTTATLFNVKWQGSRDGENWVDLTGSFVLGGALSDVHDLSANASGWRYYSLVGVSGTNANGSRWHTQVEFKIDGDAADGVGDLPSRLFQKDFPTAKLISAWMFDEEAGDTVIDHWGRNPINLANPLVTDPSVTRTRQGAALKSGLIQTPAIENVREIVVLYRTGYDQTDGFLISGGSSSGSALAQNGFGDIEAVKIAGSGFGLRVPRSRLNGTARQAVDELNRGTWTAVFRTLDANYGTILGFGGRHSATTSRCADFEIAYAFAFDAALTDGEREQVVGWLRKRAAADKGIIFHRDDAPKKAPLTVILGDSQCDGRARLETWPTFERTTNLAPFVPIMAGGHNNGRNRFFAGLVLGVNQKIDSPISNGGIEESAGLELALAADYAAALAGYGIAPHVVKYGIGGTKLRPSANGTGLDTWSSQELLTSSILHRAMNHLHRALGVMVEQGIGFGQVKFAIYLGDNDMGSTADAPDAATYQGYCQAFWSEIKARFPGIDAKAVWFRPDPNAPGDATAYANVRAGIDAFGAANSDVTVINTDAHVLTADGLHYAPAAYGLHSAALIGA